jgi:hypothetical protein
VLLFSIPPLLAFSLFTEPSWKVSLIMVTAALSLLHRTSLLSRQYGSHHYRYHLP